ncbi:hypothetical protein N7454_002409 [Penicillium verhagenii]|nr:hypothetical protein N7454_002409 [Penicillium verhagenii]
MTSPGPPKDKKLMPSPTASKPAKGLSRSTGPADTTGQELRLLWECFNSNSANRVSWETVAGNLGLSRSAVFCRFYRLKKKMQDAGVNVGSSPMNQGNNPSSESPTPTPKKPRKRNSVVVESEQDEEKTPKKKATRKAKRATPPAEPSSDEYAMSHHQGEPDEV